VIAGGATLQHETAKSGDSFSKIATRVGSTVDIITALNPTKKMVKPGDQIAYKKGAVQKYVTSWRAFDAALVATRYNGGGDTNYEKKLTFVLSLL
jgi:LysM repeat protein